MKKIGSFLKIKSLKWQLLIRSFLVLVLLLIIMGTFQYLFFQNDLYGSKHQSLEERFHNVDKRVLDSIQTPEDLKKNSDNIIGMIADRDTSAAIIDENGNVIAESMNINPVNTVPHLSKDEYIKKLSEQPQKGSYEFYEDQNDNASLITFYKVCNQYSTVGLIQVSGSVQPVHAMLHRQIDIYILVASIILIVAIFIGGAVLQHTLKPLYEITNTLDQITVGQLNMRLPADNDLNEIDSMSNAFNDMLKRIEVSFEKEQLIKEKMQQFISDASHELRTPLTSIHGFVEVLLRGAAKNEKQLDMALNSILLESDRLTKLVNDLLLLTKLDQKVEIDMAVEEVSDIIKEVYPQLKILVGDRKLQSKLKDNVMVRANRNQIKQVVYNLVHNAMQHTEEKNGVISIGISSVDKADGSYAVIEVNDNGTGIPKESLNEIFDRFFRSETHRSRKHGGYGLGLSIVKSIVDNHNGEIKVSSEEGVGTTFSVYLKLS